MPTFWLNTAGWWMERKALFQQNRSNLWAHEQRLQSEAQKPKLDFSSKQVSIEKQAQWIANYELDQRPASLGDTSKVHRPWSMSCFRCSVHRPAILWVDRGVDTQAGRLDNLFLFWILFLNVLVKINFLIHERPNSQLASRRFADINWSIEPLKKSGTQSNRTDDYCWSADPIKQQTSKETPQPDQNCYSYQISK